VIRYFHNKGYFNSPISLNIKTILFFLFCFSLLTFFCLAHVFLQFTIRDLRIETVRLQRQYEKLMAMEKQLIWKIGHLSQGDRLHEFATTELGLREVDPGSIERLFVPNQLITAYSKGGKSTGYEQAKWMEEKYGKETGTQVGSLLEINRELNAREEALDAIWKRVREKK